MPLCFCHFAQAVSDGDRERCRSLLFEARQECIRSLATVSTESVSSVNPAILQLQQLQCVQEAWAFRWPSLSLASPSSPGLVRLHLCCRTMPSVLESPDCSLRYTHSGRLNLLIVLMSQIAFCIGNLPNIELPACMLSAAMCSALLISLFTDCNVLSLQAITSAAEGSLQLADLQAVWRSREAAMGWLNTLAMLLNCTSCFAWHPKSA